MSIAANLHAFVAHGDHALDVKLILVHGRQTGSRIHDAAGFEHDDFAALGPPKIIRQSVHEQMVAGNLLGFHNRFAFAEAVPDSAAGFSGKLGFIFRTEPEGFGAANSVIIIHRDVQLVDEPKNMLRFHADHV